MLAGLNKAYNERLKTDPGLTRLVTETAEAKKNFHETKVSLNEVIRKKEMDEAEKRAASTKLNTKITSKEGIPSSDLMELDDEYLREGLFVLSDLITTKIG